METETSLVWSDSVVELYSISCVCLNITVVIYPRNAECQHSVWLHETLDDSSFLKFRMLIVNILDTLKHFSYGLQILFLCRVLGLKFGHYFLCFHYVY